MIRIGHGYDVHAFAESAFRFADDSNNAIILGGVSIAHKRTLEAHSDGDVVLHALCDALLGAAGLGDIGHHFPDTDQQWAGADSRDLLRAVMQQLHEKALSPNNIDITIIAQAPKIAPHIADMKNNIAKDCSIDGSMVNIKATTTEKLGYIGREEGIAVHAVTLLSTRS